MSSDYFGQRPQTTRGKISKHLPPAVPRSRVRGLGDLVAGLLSKIGIRPTPGCGCEKRKQKLNRFSAKLWKKV